MNACAFGYLCFYVRFGIFRFFLCVHLGIFLRVCVRLGMSLILYMFVHDFVDACAYLSWYLSVSTCPLGHFYMCLFSSEDVHLTRAREWRKIWWILENSNHGEGNLSWGKRVFVLGKKGICLGAKGNLSWGKRVFVLGKKGICLGTKYFQQELKSCREHRVNN